jgi:hypothetical protein
MSLHPQVSKKHDPWHGPIKQPTPSSEIYGLPSIQKQSLWNVRRQTWNFNLRKEESEELDLGITYAIEFTLQYTLIQHQHFAWAQSFIAHKSASSHELTYNLDCLDNQSYVNKKWISNVSENKEHSLIMMAFICTMTTRLKNEGRNRGSRSPQAATM